MSCTNVSFLVFTLYYSYVRVTIYFSRFNNPVHFSFLILSFPSPPTWYNNSVFSRLHAYFVNLINRQNTDLKETVSAFRLWMPITRLQLPCNFPPDDIRIAPKTGARYYLEGNQNPRMHFFSDISTPELPNSPFPLFWLFLWTYKNTNTSQLL